MAHAAVSRCISSNAIFTAGVGQTEKVRNVSTMGSQIFTDLQAKSPPKSSLLFRLWGLFWESVTLSSNWRQMRANRSPFLAKNVTFLWTDFRLNSAFANNCLQRRFKGRFPVQATACKTSQLGAVAFSGWAWSGGIWGSVYGVAAVLVASESGFLIAR